MKRYWGAFHWTSEHLKEQFRTCADAAQKQPGVSIDNTQSSIYQYADWFDRYPHGVSQTDFEDPATALTNEKGDDAVLGQMSDYHTVEEYFNTLASLPPQEHEHIKAAKRKSKKSASSGSQQQPSKRRFSKSSGMIPMPAIQMVNTTQQITYPLLSPTNANIFTQPAFYGNDLLFPPQPQGMLPQLDRQLVFGAYAGMDPPTGMIDNTWDMEISGLSGYTEPTSAWFMPFNVEPPDLGHDDAFNSVSAGAVDYGMGGMPVDHQGNIESKSSMDLGGANNGP